jgi:hypothetical protein
VDKNNIHKMRSRKSIPSAVPLSFLETVCTHLSNCNFNCWYKENSPIFQLGEYQIQNNFWVMNGIYRGKNDIVAHDKLQHHYNILTQSSYYKDIVSLLCTYKVHRTHSNYPFIEFEHFYWKEGYFYSKDIDIQTIIKEVKQGPVYCHSCRNNVTKFNYFDRYCEVCKTSFSFPIRQEKRTLKDTFTDFEPETHTHSDAIKKKRSQKKRKGKSIVYPDTYKIINNEIFCYITRT